MIEKMRVGWLWFDNDPNRTVEEKVLRAAQCYREKFGRAPDVCYVHPQAIGEGELRCGPVRVIAARHILLHHFWLGVEASSKVSSLSKAAA
jgi:hypothetical protein